MKKLIKKFFKDNPFVFVKSKEIAKILGYNSPREYSILKGLLKNLVEEDFLIKKGKRFGLKAGIDDIDKEFKGEIKIHPKGFGFVIVNKKHIKKIFIASRNLNGAKDGDVVKVSIVDFAPYKGNLEGKVIEIVKKKSSDLYGVVERQNGKYFVRTLNDGNLFEVDQKNLKSAKVGDLVSYDLKKINGSNKGEITFKINEVFGPSNSYEAEVKALAKELNLPYEFSRQALKEADAIDENISEEEINERLDLRDKIIFTIDPIDAKDFDDAVSIERLPDGNYLVGVHIADVSHYVKRDSSLDIEAFNRGNSVYLVGKAIPMLPEKLSNKVCSLRPNESKLTYSVLAELTPNGKLIDYQIRKTVIESKKRFTYEEAQQVLDAGEGEFYDELFMMNELAKKMRKNRIAKGSINFSTPEIKFEVDSFGVPVSAYIKKMLDTNNLIEEFMLLANQIVAGIIFKSRRKYAPPFVYRVHDLPEADKLKEFARFVKSLGYSFEISSLSNPKPFQKLLEKIQGTHEEALINEIAIRTMAKACYSTENIGHFGLGFKYYTHFTSPIRRYSDLIVHRILYKYLENKGDGDYQLDELDEICEQVNVCEREAIEAERLSVKIKQIQFLQNKVGEEFDAVISGVTNFGIFVKTEDILAEGLVRMRDLEDDYYEFDEKKYCLIGKRKKKKLRLGDKVRVKLVKVNEERRELDFILVN